MSLSTKALFVALALSLTPAIASAQVTGSVTSGPNPDLSIIATDPDRPVLPAIRPGGSHGSEVQAQDCGASQLQWLLGQHITVAQNRGITARYFTPDNRVGTTDYLPQRLNISTDDNLIITGIGCG